MPSIHATALPRPRARLVVRSLAVLALFAPFGAAAQETVLENVRFGAGSMVYEAPRLVVRGSPLSEAELKRLLDPADPQPWADRVAKIEADEILAPELIATIKLPQVDQRTTYRDVSAKGIHGGRIASVTSPLGAMEGTQQGRKVTSSNGALSVRDIDLGATFALATAKAGPAEPLKRIYGAFSVEAIKVIDQAGVTTEVARMSGTDFSAKATKAGWLGTIDVLAAADPAKSTPAAAGPAMDALAEMLESIAIGAVEASGITMKGRVEKDDAELNVAIRRMAYTGAGSGRVGELRMEGSDFRVGEARTTIGTLTFGGLDAAPAVAALREVASNPQNPSPAVLRRLLPILSSIRVEDLDVDAPPNRDGIAGASAPRTRLGMGRLEVQTEKPINGLPSDIRFVIRGMGFPVPPNSPDPNVQTIAQLGYERIEGSLGISLGWNEAGQEIVVRDLSLEGKDMGVVTLRGVIGGVSRDIFAEDTALAGVALATAAAKGIDLVVDNRGLFERIIAREAQRQKRPAEDVRREYGMAASFGIPAILGSGPSAKALATAVSRFVAKPGKLTIEARAKRPGGFGFADYMANPTPAGVLDAVDIRASAE